MSAYPSIIPGLRYRDAHRAIEWLQEVFGFQTHLIVEDDHGGVAHAQLTLENGMIMLGSARDDAFGQLMAVPGQIDGKNTQSAYVVLEDDKLESLFKRITDRNVEVLMPLEKQDYGGQNFACRDLEGHIWSFGSYDPFAEMKSQ